MRLDNVTATRLTEGGSATVSPAPSVVGMALGGEAARGLAHIGVLEVLER